MVITRRLLWLVTVMALLGMAFGACGPTRYTLSTSAIPADGGNISPTEGTYDIGESVFILANPATGYRFDHWEGNATGTSPFMQLVMDGDMGVTAYFTRQYTLSVSCAPPGSGTVNISGGTYDAGTQVTLVAKPAKDYMFDGWGGDASGSSSPLTVTMTSNKAIVASFSCAVCVYQGEQPPYARTGLGYDTIELVDNPNATDPTWLQLKAFITADKTDKKPYIEDIYMCGAFAEDVHNNAEAAGIKAAWISIDFRYGSAGHALDAFNTTDRGLVYVDCTSSYNVLSPRVCQRDPSTGRCVSTNEEPSSYDKIAYLSIGREYGSVSLSFAKGFSYSDYETYCQRKDAYDTALAQYNSAVERYNTWVALYDDLAEQYQNSYDRCGVWPLAWDCQRLSQWYDDLERQRLELDRQYSQLDSQYAQLKAQEAALGDLWEPLGIVSKIEIYW
jgi:hypothetical protein